MSSSLLFSDKSERCESVYDDTSSIVIKTEESFDKNFVMLPCLQDMSEGTVDQAEVEKYFQLFMRFLIMLRYSQLEATKLKDKEVCQTGKLYECDICGKSFNRVTTSSHTLVLSNYADI